ncbi:MAG: hypothetical protein N4A47_00960 [Clostridia bacterium]|jgi:hypothetical protein|nr:hypothetical protein [Clostridia bacterium]
MKNLGVKLVISFFVVFSIVKAVDAVTYEPGSIKDPVVTKSYVDSELEKLKESLGDIKVTETNDKSDRDSEETSDSKELKEMMDLLTEQYAELKSNVNTSNGKFVAIDINEGQSLLGKESTEIILRSGKAVALASEAGGLQDITDGIDISQDQDIPKYHLLITPRDDERGILMKTYGWVMVRGEYEIK